MHRSAIGVEVYVCNDVFIGVDFDECTIDNGGCEQKCVNQVASVPQCLCFQGFTLDSNGINCTGMQKCL